MSFWMTLWKWLMILSVGGFATMALWVTFQGARDIKSLLIALKEGHEHTDDTTKE